MVRLAAAADAAAPSRVEMNLRTSDFAGLAAAIAIDAGFSVNFRKTRILHRATRKCVCGVVVNVHANVARPE
jgi:hypothetical protein